MPNCYDWPARSEPLTGFPNHHYPAIPWGVVYARGDSMVLPFLFALATQAPDKGPVELKSRIIEASIFKSGLVMLTREVIIPKGSGAYRLDVLPSALDGTFWYGSPDHVSITDVSTVLRINDKKEKDSAGSILELLALNVGKKVTLVERPSVPGGAPTKVTGTVLKAGNNPYGTATMLKLDSGGFYSPSVAMISEVQGKDLKSTTDRIVKSADLRIQFKASAEAPSRLQFIDLETGAAWTSSYLIKLGAEHKAEIQGKAQIAVGGLSFHNTKILAMAGEPNLPTTAKFDLAAGYGSLMAYLSGSQERYRGFRDDQVDPYTLLPALNANNQGNVFSQNPYIGNFGGGGGMGGMGGGGFPMNRIEEATDLRNLPNDSKAARLEGLYSYPMGDLDMEPGDRVTRLLFSQNAKYETLYKWTADGNNTTIYNTLRLTNTSKIPWTGGPALVLRDGQPLAQLPMPFTGLNGTADLNLGTAQDVLVHREDKQTKLDDQVKVLLGYQTKKSTQEIKLVVENTRDEFAPLEINLTISGDVADGDGATIRQLPIREDSFNWQREVKWNVILNPHERREITLTYTRIIVI